MLRENLKIGKIKFLTVAMICGVAFTSCNDAIYIDPADEIVESNAITTVDDFESATIGVYATMGGASSVEWNSLFTDELQLPASNNGNGIQVHTWSINTSTTEAATLYGSYFLTINRANKVLEALPAIIAENAAEQATLDGYEGELLAIRGWAHFKALTLFSESYTDDSALAVPYLDYAVVLEKPARNTVGEVLAGINADLVAARNLIPASASNNIFMTRDAITALEARMALYTEDYPTAITKSTELINSYPLATTATYAAVWQDANETENIFKLARVQGDGSIGQIYATTAIAVDWLASDKIVSLYETGDVRASAFFTDGNFINKYPGDVSSFGLNDIKVFRVSEQYLIRAEAYANSSQLGLAADDYNTLRSNRITGVTDATFGNILDAMSMILEERAREFAFEGHRFFDLKRTGSDVERAATDCGVLSADACELDNSDYRFTLPIPQTEIFTNPNVIQNTGYNN
ncbi:RagB/SusD family nutrient uptake outer membrane protein [Lacinutrix undariae]